MLRRRLSTAGPCVRQSPPHAQRGLSLVELMVGITVGLFVVAAATTLMSAQLVDNRRLLLETQLQQDLRASLDIISRQIRRAGAITAAGAEGTVAAGAGVGGTSNSDGPIALNANPGSDVQFSFYRNGSDFGPYGFRRQGSVLQTLVVGVPQDLTDSSTVKVTDFKITPTIVSSTVLPCPKLCPGNTTACWPTLVVRDYKVLISAEAASDRTVQRTLQSTVRVRNDWVQFASPANPGNTACPA